MKYRKRPVEAFQMTKERRLSNENWPHWMHEAWNKSRSTEGALWPEFWPHSDGKDRLVLGISERTWTLVKWGDYIVRDSAGYLHVEDQKFFEEEYEEIDD